MSQQIIDIGSTANDGTGTSAREAGVMLNEMFTELYAAIDALGTASEQDVEYFATAAQGAKADTAVQFSDLNVFGALAMLDAITVDLLTATGTPNSSTFLRGDWTWASPAGGGGGDLLAANNLSDLDDAADARDNLGLGTAATTAATDYATAAQGELADTAIQPEDLATVATTGAYSDLSGLPTLGTAAAAATSDFASASHATATDNPHSVTASQVGLGNVDNTSDANKPISTLTQSALDGKAAATHSHAISDVTGLQDALDAKATSSDIDNALAAKFVEISEEDYDLLDPPTQGVWYGVPL